MDRLLAQDAITRTIVNFNAGLDTLNERLFKSAFSLKNTPTTFDASAHISGAQPMTLPPDELWTAMSGSVAGFSALQHLLGLPVFEFKNDGLTEAQVEVNAWAYHCIEGDDGTIRDMTTRVVERADMRLEEGRWIVTRMAIVRYVPVDLGLYGIAAERAKNGLGRKPTTG